MASKNAKVYLVETGTYEERFVEGIYATPGAAMAANPPRPPKENQGRATHERPGGWQPDDEGRWANGLDWGDHATICEMEIGGDDRLVYLRDIVAGLLNGPFSGEGPIDAVAEWLESEFGAQ